MAVRSLVPADSRRRFARAALPPRVAISAGLAALGALALLTACGPEPVAVAPGAGAMASADPQALTTLDEGEREIGAAAGDCGRACAGLGRVVRARAGLCVPRSTACVDAERREGVARKRVESFCEPCGDAP
jgi:hypothetical protein